MFLLALPLWLNVAVTLVAAVVVSVVLYCAVHPFWASDTSEETRRLADTAATRIGVVHAVVIGMMFTYVRMEHNQMMEAIEAEASALARLYQTLERTGDPRWGDVKEDLLAYVRFVVDVQWPAMRELRVQPDDQVMLGRTALDKIRTSVDQFAGDSSPAIQVRIRDLLDEVDLYRAQRLFDAKGAMLPIFWAIALAGYLLTVVTFFFPPPTLRRCVLVSLYSATVALVLLGVFVLTHPYSPAAGVQPTAFEMLLQGAPK